MKRIYKKPLIMQIAVRSAIVAASVKTTSEAASKDYEGLSKEYSGGIWDDDDTKE